MPDFKTIADFRKDNGEAIRKVCRAFVLLCRRLDLLSDASVAIDGSKFKAVNARDRNFTEAKMKRRLAQIDRASAAISRSSIRLIVRVRRCRRPKPRGSRRRSRRKGRISMDLASASAHQV
jgi:hypothetical protein